jgi:hypothetical protein
MAEKSDLQTIHDPEAQLERAFIAEFLQRHGYDDNRLRALPSSEQERLLKDAVIYAAGKLAEVEARARYVDEIHSAQ